MGGGSWSAVSYASTTAKRIASGTTFDYSHTTTTTTPRTAWKAHDTLDPKGVVLRESRDNDEHPTSTAIAVLFDVTGSMGTVPRQLQEKLPELFGLILRKGYVEHPQILFGAIGDATCDKVSLQAGQFESDNRLDENLNDVLLEGGGGGQKTESYELAMYFMARHTATDCYDKRGHRGYLFIIGDEAFYPNVKWREVREVIGDDVSEDIPTEMILAELQEKWDVWFIHPMEASYAHDPEVDEPWRKLLGQQYVQLDEVSAVCETIALTIGLAEGNIDLDEGLDHLKEIGSTSGVSVGKALATVGSRGSIVESDTPDGLAAESGDEVTRL
jgi:hypothetical protein